MVIMLRAMLKLPLFGAFLSIFTVTSTTSTKTSAVNESLGLLLHGTDAKNVSIPWTTNSFDYLQTSVAASGHLHPTTTMGQVEMDFLTADPGSHALQLKAFGVNRLEPTSGISLAQSNNHSGQAAQITDGVQTHCLFANEGRPSTVTTTTTLFTHHGAALKSLGPALTTAISTILLSMLALSNFGPMAMVVAPLLLLAASAVVISSNDAEISNTTLSRLSVDRVDPGTNNSITDLKGKCCSMSHAGKDTLPLPSLLLPLLASLWLLYKSPSKSLAAVFAQTVSASIAPYNTAKEDHEKRIVPGTISTAPAITTIISVPDLESVFWPDMPTNSLVPDSYGHIKAESDPTSKSYSKSSTHYTTLHVTRRELSRRHWTKTATPAGTESVTRKGLIVTCCPAPSHT